MFLRKNAQGWDIFKGTPPPYTREMGTICPFGFFHCFLVLFASNWGKKSQKDKWYLLRAPAPRPPNKCWIKISPNCIVSKQKKGETSFNYSIFSSIKDLQSHSRPPLYYYKRSCDALIAHLEKGGGLAWWDRQDVRVHYIIQEKTCARTSTYS